MDTELAKKSREGEGSFNSFEFHTSGSKKAIETIIQECLEVIQEKLPDSDVARGMAYPVVVSALASVGAWHHNETRESIIDIGALDWDENLGRRIPLESSWRQIQRMKRILPFLPETTQYKWVPTSLQPVRSSENANVDMASPTDGPEEVWNAIMHPRAGRRCILSYVHDKSCDIGGARESEVLKNSEHRRAVRLTRAEIAKVSKPRFFNSNNTVGLDELWHDGMKYPSPDGQWNSYAGVVPYMLPGSAVWHLVPRIRESSRNLGYPSTGIENFDRIIFSFSKLRQKQEIRGLPDINVDPATDKPYRDLSGVLRLWMMAEATCGMLRDEVIISIQDMAGLALTFMHYDNLLNEMITIISKVIFDAESSIKRKKKLLCFKPQLSTVKWLDLCKTKEGALAIIKQTMDDAECKHDAWDFVLAMVQFQVAVIQLKFWYSLLLAEGQILDLSNLRFEILEDLAVAPAWDERDHAKVYFMIEASLINRVERNIPYEVSIQRFLSAFDRGGRLLIESINVRANRIEMEMTRSQMRDIIIHDMYAKYRQPNTWRPLRQAMVFAWLSGKPGLSYVGRFTTSYSKPLYIEAAQAWGNKTMQDIMKMGTESKQRMVVLLTNDHRLFRKVDDGSRTVVTMCSVFFLNQDEHNNALAAFGNESFHAEERVFKGAVERRDDFGNAIDFQNERKALCAVNQKGNYFEIDYPSRAYQIVVTHQVGRENYVHLAAIRIIPVRQGRVPAAVSYSEVVRHIQGSKRDQLLTMRPDRMSPDGEELADFSFEYDNFWVNTQGRKCANTDSGDLTESEFVHSVVSFLREKDWGDVQVGTESVIGSDSD